MINEHQTRILIHLNIFRRNWYVLVDPEESIKAVLDWVVKQINVEYVYFSTSNGQIICDYAKSCIDYNNK